MLPIRTLLLCLSLCVLATVALAQPTTSPAGPPGGFQPLNLLVTPARIAQVQAALPSDPVLAAAHAELMQAAAGTLTYTPAPIQGVLSIPGYYTSQKATNQRLTRHLRSEALAAHTLALAAAFGASSDHARKSEEILFAWVDQLTGAADGPFHIAAPHGDTALVIAYSFPRFCYAYDILNGLGRIDAGERARFRAWLGKFVAYVRSRPGLLVDRWNNHHAWKTLFFLCAGHVLEDRALFAHGLEGYREGLARQVDGQGAMWRELVRGKKAATYTVMCLEAMVQSAVIGQRHGQTVAADLAVIRPAPAGGAAPITGEGNALKAALDLLAEFIEHPASWNRFRLLTGTTQLNGPATVTDWGWLYELPAVWWSDPRHARLIGGTYGHSPARAYTFSFATLLFRPASGGGSAPIGSPGAGPPPRGGAAGS